MKNNIYSVLGMAALFIIVQVIAIAIAPVYSEAESEALGGKETIENPSFAFFYLGIILLVTFIILYIAKRKKERFIKILILAAIFMTMVYLFIPLTLTALYPPSDDGWGYNKIGFAVTALNAGDVDNDGVIEIIAGCSDNKIRVYESENHTLEWESEELNANVTKIMIGNYDEDDSVEIVVFTGAIWIFDGANQSKEWNSSFGNGIPAITGADLTGDNICELIFGTPNMPSIFWMNITNDSQEYVDVFPSLNNIVFLETTDDARIVAADNSTIILLNPVTKEKELEITELDDIRALTVYQNPNDEDYIIGADEERAYIYNLSSPKYIRRGPEFKDIRGLFLEHYSIPDYNDSIPDVIAVSEKTIYISPDLLKNDEGYYYLKFKYMLYSFLSTNLDENADKEIVLGVEDGYKSTSIVFGEGTNLLVPVVISILAALSLTLLVHKYPEWYVVDSVGLVMAIGATVILGVTFDILPAIVLLIVLALYDAISVYKTKHMITLADSVIDLNLPVLLVIPKKWSYSYRVKKPRLKEQLESGEEREAMFMGLGDIVIPSLLIISSLSFLPTTQSGLGIAGNILVAFGTMIGILIGFSVLMRFVLKGNPQAGLPLLNSGAIIGYLVTYILVFGDFSFGFNLNFMGV